jgi:hypothetical protein
MANKAKNTEHSGAKNRGNGYLGKRSEAKLESKKKRREDSKKIIRSSFNKE